MDQETVPNPQYLSRMRFDQYSHCQLSVISSASFSEIHLQQSTDVMQQST